jgi:Putative zinc-finger
VNSRNENRPVKCANPIDAAVLGDYWLNALTDSDEAAIEEHLFECDDCGERLREVIALAEGIRELASEGSLRMVVSDAFLERASAEGLRVRQYSAPAGGSVECTVTADDDLLIGRLAANLSAVRRVDLCVYDDTGVEKLRLSDIPIRSGASSVIYQESITFAKAAPTNTMIIRLVTFDEAGIELPLGEYTFNHTRSLPGPGAW